MLEISSELPNGTPTFRPAAVLVMMLSLPVPANTSLWVDGSFCTMHTAQLATA